MNTKVNEGKLISGKEALIALANGEEVEYWCENDPSIQKRWTLIESLSEYKLSYFLEDKPRFEFRLKPRTITINGIEVPAPFKPKVGDEFWILFESHYSPCGYKLVLPGDQYSEPCYGAWRSEEEIRQVAAALRQAFRQALGGSHDN